MNSDLVKGILIALVIIDHNDFSHELFPQFLNGFSFHVLAFLALPFVRSTPPLSLLTLQKHFYRLYYPFLVVAVTTGIVFCVHSGHSFADEALALSQALYSGNADSLKRATNMGLLWFLPSLFSLMVIKGVLEAAPMVLRQTLLAGIFIVHFVIGIIALRAQDYLPLGLLPALYVVPLVYTVAIVHLRVLCPLRRELALLAVIILFILVKYAQIKMDLFQEIGFSQVADYRSPTALFVNDLEGIFGTLLVFQLGRFSLFRWIETVGKHSLPIYLFHAFIGRILYVAVASQALITSPLLCFIVTAMLTLILSTKLAQLLMRIQFLRQLLFPDNRAELPGRRNPYPAPE
ncbi:MAG TPA: acyltransferase family protein [Noviherbaspirillum sp.]|nr:acyltransferase family protein [Noviherbaspirillum sp.]